MRILCGTDIIEISRIKESIEKFGNTFINTVFNDEEIEYCEETHNAKYLHYAARFAAKEAIFKVVSPLLKNKFDISWKNAKVINDKNGRPRIKFIDIEFNQIESIDISISHCKEYAIAVVTAIIKE